MSISRTLTHCVCSLIVAVLAAPAIAQLPPVQTTQAPGFYHRAIGDFTVTAIYDGPSHLSPELLSGASQKDIKALLENNFTSNTAINSFLVHTNKNLILIDTGSGACLGQDLGKLSKNIGAAGYELEQIDTILLTHLHPDHVCGLIDADGQPVFKSAQVYVSKIEADFWLDPKQAAKAHKSEQGAFTLAGKSLAPYQVQKRLHLFTAGDNSLPAGFKAVPTPGHTLGHTSFLVESKGKSILIWGDIVNSYAVQLARPDVAIVFDYDSMQANATRKKVLADAVKDKRWIAGAHLPFPGIGHVRKADHGYSWLPAEYAPIETQKNEMP